MINFWGKVLGLRIEVLSFIKGLLKIIRKLWKIENWNKLEKWLNFLIGKLKFRKKKFWWKFDKFIKKSNWDLKRRKLTKFEFNWKFKKLNFGIKFLKLIKFLRKLKNDRRVSKFIKN